MGTNLFVEGNPAPFVISVRIPREVVSFNDVRQVTAALATVDKELSSLWWRHWPSGELRKCREVRLLRFNVSSPPSFEILADPAWLGLFLAALTFYKPAKESAIELANDLKEGARGVEQVLARVQGLTDRQMQLLGISVYMTAQRIAEACEDGGVAVSTKFGRFRKNLLGDSEENPEIQVIDVENKHRPW